MKLLLSILLLSQFAFGVTANKVWRQGTGAGIPSWGAVNLSSTNAITGQMPSKTYLPTIGQQTSVTSSGGFTTSSTSYVDITNVTVSITTTGRPVLVFLISGDIGVNTSTSGAQPIATVKFVRDSTDLSEMPISVGGVGSTHLMYVPASSFMYIDAPGAGTYVYKAQMKVSGSTPTGFADSVKIMALEL